LNIGINDFIETGSIAPGMVLEVNPGVYDNEEPYPLLGIGNEEFAPNSIGIKTPKKMNENIAWFLGYLWGDGSMSENKHRVRFIDGNTGNLERVRSILSEEFGIEANIHKANNKKAWTLDAGSVQLWKWMLVNGFYKYDGDKIAAIPKAVRYSSWRHIIAFIAGLVDADAGIGRSCTHDTVTLAQSGKNQVFTRHLQDVALAVGLVFGHSENTKGDNFQKKKSIILMSLAGASIPRATRALSELSGKCLNLELKNNENTKKTRILGKVVSVELVGKMETFDVEVENSHWYYAGAIKSHNTASLVAGTSSGIHAWHDKFYIRRMRFNKTEPIAKYLMARLPYSVESNDADPEIVEDDVFNPHQIVVAIPQRAPEGAITRDEGALNLLERVKRYTREWIRPGNEYGGMTNNISATVNIRDHEWAEVENWMWNNRYEYNGLSLLPYSDHSYRQPPFQSCDEDTFNRMKAKIEAAHIDLTEVAEAEDNTELSMIAACAGGACEWTP
jgi:hypothetical protein